MKRRFRRRKHAEPEDRPFWLARVPAGVFWTVAAAVVLVLVLGYDRHIQRGGKDHIEVARDYENDGKYEDAVEEYNKALSNLRLSRKARAEVALRIGDTYAQRMNENEMANAYYVRARHIYPKITSDPGVLLRMQAARTKAVANGTTEPLASWDTVRLEGLPPQPHSDTSGPVIARLNDRDVHAGEIVRYLRAEGIDPALLAREDPKRLQDRIDEYLDTTLSYEAAIEGGLHRDPAFRERLHDYQRTLLSDLYRTQALARATQVSRAEIEKYFEANRSRYAEPARIGLAMIKTPTEERAKAAQQVLHSGKTFESVVSAFSVDAATTPSGGVIGMLSVNDEFIPNVGRAPELLRELAKLKQGDVTGIQKVGDAYYIFRVVRQTVGRDPHVDEVRGQIEAILRREKSQSAAQNVREQLRRRFDLQITDKGFRNLADFASPETTVTAETRPTTGSAASK